MDVLQTAVSVIGNIDAQVLVHKTAPQGGDIAGRCLAGKEQALDLIAHHDVEGIGELVGLGANERGARDVDGTVELVFAHLAVDLRDVLA